MSNHGLRKLGNCLVKTKVTVYYEQKLRTDSVYNTKMRYLNVQLSGLSGRPHPALLGIISTQDVKFSHPSPSDPQLTQFILDCNSINLGENFRSVCLHTNQEFHRFLVCRATELKHFRVNTFLIMTKLNPPGLKYAF